MSPRPARGRRPKTWTHQQKRNLVRLYTLTTLSNAEILAVLGGETFSPSERHALMKLREIYSKEYIEDLYGLRPRSEAIMRSRLKVLRQSRSCRVSKAARYSRLKIHSNILSSRPNSIASNFDHSFRKLPNQRSCSGGSISEEPFNAFRNYHAAITPDLQIHLSECTLPDSQPTNSALLMLDGSTVSNQSLIAPPELESAGQDCPFCLQPTYKSREFIQSLDCGHVCHNCCLSEFFSRRSHDFFEFCPICNAELILSLKSSINPRELVLASKSKREYNTVDESANSTNISTIPTPDEQRNILEVISSPDAPSLTKQQDSVDDLDSTRQRLHNRSSSYIEHVTSVVRLSLSDSYRTSTSLSRVASSLEWTVSSRSSWMSMSSKSTDTGSARASLQSVDEQPRQGLLSLSRRMLYKVARPLAKGERDIWNEIVDEGQLLPAPESRPEYPETGLFDRACPGTLHPFDKSCSHCGYSIGWYHILNGRYLDIDSLGNTKLHYAAACGGAILTLSFFRLLVSQGVNAAARNSSGQTFMHVLRTRQFIQSQGLTSSWGYIALLKFLSGLNFPFSQRDFHGRTIAHLICKDGGLFSGKIITDYRFSKIYEILQILNTDMNILDNHGFNAGDELLLSAENANWSSIDSVSLLERFLAIYRRPGLLQTNFRESMAKPDWTPRTWIKWLQEANLIDWIDIHGDTPLTALLKNRRSEDQQAALAKMIPKLVQLGVDVDMRDRKGHTAIAIAAIRGSLSCVQALIDAGASVNVVNYNGRDIVSMASWRMKMAKQEGKTQCYARILACANLIMDTQLKETRS